MDLQSEWPPVQDNKKEPSEDSPQFTPFPESLHTEGTTDTGWCDQ